MVNVCAIELIMKRCTIISVFILSCSCADNNISFIDITKAKTESLESIASDIKVIPLRDNSSDSVTLVGDIYSLKSYGKRVFLYDDRARKILYYDDGIYAGQIDKVGRGPEEYIDIGTFAYDAKRDMVALFDRHKRTLKFYSCATMRLEREIRLDYYIATLEHLSGGVYLMVKEQTSDDDAAIVILNMDNNSIIASHPITPLQSDLLSDLAVTRGDGDSAIIALPGYINCIYRADSSGFVEVSTIFFGRYGADRKFWNGKRDAVFYIEELLNNSVAAIAPSYYITDGNRESFWYVSKYSNDMHSQPIMSLYTSKGNDCKVVSELIIDGIDGEIQPLCGANGYYYTLVYPHQISEQTNQLSPIAAEIAATADYENGNPSIVAFKL